jgi:hypothetical protein
MYPIRGLIEKVTEHAQQGLSNSEASSRKSKVAGRLKDQALNPALHCYLLLYLLELTIYTAAQT